MFCQNCGNEINDNAVVCIHCGCAVPSNTETKSMAATVLLWFFLGGFGAHRYYLGDTLGGTLMLLCLVFCWLVIPGVILGIWWIVDIILLITGGLKPKNGAKFI